MNGTDGGEPTAAFSSAKASRSERRNSKKLYLACLGIIAVCIIILLMGANPFRSKAESMLARLTHSPPKDPGAFCGVWHVPEGKWDAFFVYQKAGDQPIVVPNQPELGSVRVSAVQLTGETLSFVSVYEVAGGLRKILGDRLTSRHVCRIDAKNSSIVYAQTETEGRRNESRYRLDRPWAK